MNLASLDLNLVVALRALLEERNVTRAGQRIGLSQPAMSARPGPAAPPLRRRTARPVGNHYELTALGQALLDRTATACDLLERVFTSQADFDPADGAREFTLLASDYAVAVFGAELARTVARRRRPASGCASSRPRAAVVENTATLLSTTDGLLMPHGIISGFPAVELYQDRWVFLVAEDNPEVGDQLTLDDLARLPWVDLPAHLRRPGRPAAQHARDRTAGRRSPSTASRLLPFMVAGTRRIALVQERLAERLRGVGRRTRHAPPVRGRTAPARPCGGTRSTRTTPPTSGCARPPREWRRR